MKKSLLFLISLFPAFLWGESKTISGFRGLHDSDAAILIGDNEAQDLSNVDLTDSGLGVKKRSGTSLFKSVGASTAGVTGGYYFRDVAGHDNLISANNGIVYYSRSGGDYTSFITTDTPGAYYDFTDSNGYLWRSNSSHDQICKWDGTTLTYYPNHPKGDQIEVLPDRLVISGVAATPNTVYFSGAADFTNFETGVEETSPFTEDFGLPGQNVTAIKTMCGGVGAWTKDTLSLWTGTNQFDGQIIQISPNIGTLQPSTIIQDGGNTFWQAQDGNFYQFDCNSVTRISENLNISNILTGDTKNWNPSSQAEWEAGTLWRTTTTLSLGDIVLSTWTGGDSSNSDFILGTTSNTLVSGNAVYLATNDVNLSNYSFESGSGADADNWTGSNWTERASAYICTPDDGSYFSYRTPGSDGFWYSYGVRVIILSTSNVVLGTLDTHPSAPGGYPDCNWITETRDLSSYIGRWIKIKIGCPAYPTYYITSDQFLCSGGNLTFRIARGWVSFGGNEIDFIDNVKFGRSTIFSGTFTSRSIDTQYDAGGWLSSEANWATNGNAISIQTQSSADSDSWSSLVSWTTGTAPSNPINRYIRYVVSMSTGGSYDATARPQLTSATFSARSSTGSYISEARNIGTGITAWRNFTVNQNLGGGGIQYFIRTATGSSALAGASWTSMTNGSQITASTNPWIQAKAIFSVDSGTETPTLSDFTINWDEGTQTHNWGVIDKDHRLIWSVSDGQIPLPNISYIFDQKYSAWLKYSFSFEAPTRYGNVIYFGSPSTGYIYNWPSGNSDNGSAITAYWKSKDFPSGDPFSEKDFTRYSFIGKSYPGSNIDFTYDIDDQGGETVNFSLTDPLSNKSRRFNDYFPSGTTGSLINFSFGNDDADAPFEVHAFGYEYTPRPWRVMQ